MPRRALISLPALGVGGAAQMATRLSGRAYATVREQFDAIGRFEALRKIPLGAVASLTTS